MGQVAVCHDNYGGDHFRYGWPDVHVLNEEFQKHIIEQDASGNREGITGKLDPAPDLRTGEGDVFGQEEATGKGNRENKQKSRYVRTDGRNAQLDNLFVKDVMIENEVEDNVKRRI